MWITFDTVESNHFHCFRFYWFLIVLGMINNDQMVSNYPSGHRPAAQYVSSVCWIEMLLWKQTFQPREMSVQLHLMSAAIRRRTWQKESGLSVSVSVLLRRLSRLVCQPGFQGKSPGWHSSRKSVICHSFLPIDNVNLGSFPLEGHVKQIFPWMDGLELICNSGKLSV